MEYPESKEPKVRIEYSITQNNETIKVNPIAVETDNSISAHINKGINTSSRKYLNESITFPSRQALLNQHFLEIKSIYKELNFSDPQIALTAFNIIQLCVIKNILDIKIAKSSDNELLIYRKKNGAYSNLVFDEDGDISYLYIGTKPGTEKTEYFPKKNGFDYSRFASML